MEGAVVEEEVLVAMLRLCSNNDERLEIMRSAKLSWYEYNFKILMIVKMTTMTDDQLDGGSTGDAIIHSFT